MAIDIITGKVFQPKFEGQRTAVDLEAIMEKDGLTAEEAVARVLDERYAQNSYYQAGRPELQAEYDRMHEEALKSDSSAVRHVVTEEEVAEAAERIPKLAEQAMVHLEGGGTNPFLRTESGLDNWVPRDAAGNALDYGVPIDRAWTAAHVGTTTTVNADGSSTITYDDGTTEVKEPTVTPGDDSETASSIIRDALSAYGLDALVDNENLRLIDRWVETGDMDAVWAAVKQTPEYEGRFPGMEALAAAGRAISEGTYIEMERAYAQTLQAYDMPKTFYDDPSDFGTLIGGDVSINEFTQRVATAFEAANGTTAEVRDALGTYYGINDSDLAAYYLDPERATSIFEERERLGAARLGGIAAETGFGSINRQTAERLQAAGVTDTMARRGFQEVAQSTLAEESVGDVGDITRTDLVGDKFGTDPESARRIEERRQRRLAAFSQSGGPVMTQGGYTGLGAAT